MTHTNSTTYSCHPMEYTLLLQDPSLGKALYDKCRPFPALDSRILQCTKHSSRHRNKLPPAVHRDTETSSPLLFIGRFARATTGRTSSGLRLALAPPRRRKNFLLGTCWTSGWLDRECRMLREECGAAFWGLWICVAGIGFIDGLPQERHRLCERSTIIR
jgi:hypothetical protein